MFLLGLTEKKMGEEVIAILTEEEDNSRVKWRDFAINENQ